MDVVIINSPLFRTENKLYDEDSLPPIGLGYIATHLRRNGYTVELIDAVFERISLNRLINRLILDKPKFIALNIFTTNYDIVNELVEAIPFKTHFIIGGLSTKELYKKILGWETPNNIDVVIGDGELITTDIVGDSLIEVPYIQQDKIRVFRADGESKYLVRNISDVQLDRDFFKNEPVKHPLGFTEANIVTSRGCIYNCSFCAAARSLNKDLPIREMSEESIIKEIQNILLEYPLINSIRVLDDLFLKTNKTVDSAIRVFSKFELQWRSMAHVMTFQHVNEDVMRDLKASGCYELFIGIESGSPAILSSIHKTKNVDTIITNLTKIFQAGINIKGYFIYGFPDETIEDMEMTYQLAVKLKNIACSYGVNFRTSVFQYRPYHASEIYHDLQSNGLDLEVLSTEPNEELSSLVGRLQFNFHSGNYSKVDFETLHSYIYRTINLNDGEIFSGLKPQTRPLRK